MNINLDLDKLKRLHAAATPGTWKHSIVKKSGRHQLTSSTGRPIALLWSCYDYPAGANGQFIAAMYNTFSTIVAEIERLREVEEMAMKCEGVSEVTGELTLTAEKLREWLAARDAHIRREGAAEWLGEQRAERRKGGE